MNEVSVPPLEVQYPICTDCNVEVEFDDCFDCPECFAHWCNTYGPGTREIEQFPITDHIWVGVAGHPDDPECSQCGESKYDHKERYE